MLEIQAFGLLKISIKELGGSSTSLPAAVGNPGYSASIGACADPERRGASGQDHVV